MKKAFIAAVALLLTFTAIAQSKVEKIDNFKSKLVEKRNVEVYLPAAYFTDPKAKFPVLYMQDGQNVFNAETAMNHTAWEADATADKLIANKSIKPVIIVAIWNSPLRINEYFPEKAAENFTEDDRANVAKLQKQMGLTETKLLGDEYLKFLVTELKPYIDKTYRTLPDAANTAIAGSSMGALISLYAVCEYPDVFGKAACLSTHWPVMMDNSNMQPSMAIKKYVFEHLPNPAKHKLYFDYGTATLDQYYEVHQKNIDEILKQRGYREKQNWVTRKFDKAPHLEKAWAERFDQVLTFLFTNNTRAGLKTM